MVRETKEMIDAVTVEGRKATIAYLKRGLLPGTKEDHDMVKIMFEDGECRIAFRAKKPDGRGMRGAH